MSEHRYDRLRVFKNGHSYFRDTRDGTILVADRSLLDYDPSGRNPTKTDDGRIEVCLDGIERVSINPTQRSVAIPVKTESRGEASVLVDGEELTFLQALAAQPIRTVMVAPASEAPAGWNLPLMSQGCKVTYGTGSFGRSDWLVKRDGEALAFAQMPHHAERVVFAALSPVQRHILDAALATGVMHELPLPANELDGPAEESELWMLYSPATGRRNPEPPDPAEWREMNGECAWLFNPWTGDRRSAEEVGQDTFGEQLTPPTERKPKGVGLGI